MVQFKGSARNNNKTHVSFVIFSLLQNGNAAKQQLNFNDNKIQILWNKHLIGHKESHRKSPLRQKYYKNTWMQGKESLLTLFNWCWTCRHDNTTVESLIKWWNGWMAGVARYLTSTWTFCFFSAFHIHYSWTKTVQL